MDGTSFVMGFGTCAVMVATGMALFVWAMKRGDARLVLRCTCGRPTGSVHRGECRLVEAWVNESFHTRGHTDWGEVDLTGTVFDPSTGA